MTGTRIGTLHVRRSVLVDAPPEQVWETAFTSEARLREWLGLGHTLHALEPVVGGRVDFSVDVDGETRHFGGRVRACEPAGELTFDSQWAGAHAWPVATFWTVRLTPLYGGTHVELFHHGFERLGADAADTLAGYESGWGVRHLVALRSLVESSA